MTIVPRLVGGRLSSVKGERTYPIILPSSQTFRLPDIKRSSTYIVCQNLLVRLSK